MCPGPGSGRLCRASLEGRPDSGTQVLLQQGCQSIVGNWPIPVADAVSRHLCVPEDQPPLAAFAGAAMRQAAFLGDFVEQCTLP